MRTLPAELRRAGRRPLAALALSVALALPPLSAAQPETPPPSAEASIAAAGLEDASTGYIVMDLDGGAVLASRRADEAFLPASTAKIATAVAALEILGGEHRFETSLRVSGDRLYLVGGGDPLLAVEDLMSLARAGAEAGIGRARFFHDDSLLAPAAEIDAGQSDRATYNPGVSALSLSFNRRRLVWGAKPGGGLAAFALPDGDLAPLRAALGKGEPLFHRLETPDGPSWRVTARRPGRTWVPVRRPSRFTASLFRELAAFQGLALTEPEAGTAPADARPVARHRGPRLVDIAALSLQYSNNLVAELMGLGASRRLAGRPETLEASAARLQAELDRRIGGGRAGWLLDRHSGLSSRARTSPRRMAALLRYADDRRYGGRSFESLLPISGWKGSLAGWDEEPALAFRVWAKTGSMYYGRGLAGYLHSASGRRLVFALFTSDLDERRRLDALGPEPGEEERERGEAWLERARDLERALLKRWASAF
ncbi:MAG: D-alanyl-D-alanine carboxypeptidase [Alphaproteobacteria bacterium]|nr:D-alanyl-D-alanine carboxypeptidase [Alphaproteobacteria bacterium]